MVKSVLPDDGICTNGTEKLQKGTNMEGIRLNKYLSEQGVCSRREADRLIEAGKVTIDGRRAEMGEKVTGQERIICDGKPVGKAAGSKRQSRCCW